MALRSQSLTTAPGVTERRPSPGSSRGVGDWLFTGVTTALMLVALWMALIWAPTEAVQGAPQRIVYFHVGTAWVAFLAFFVVCVASVMFLIRGTPVWDRVARSSAEIGVVYTTLVLIGGAIWGKPIWGTWWSWDPRLTTTLILWFIYIGYLMLRAYVGNDNQRARFAAVVGIVGFVDVPIVYYSVEWWRSLHPVQSIVRGQTTWEMTVTTILATIAFTVLYAWMLRQKLQIERLRDRAAQLQPAEGQE